jgi:acyl-coenzyme A thioesterase PaaI-like protein
MPKRPLLERLPPSVVRRVFNVWPCYRGTGGRVVAIDGDWRRLRVEVPLSRATRNYVGTIFGGSMFGAVDPIYMLMLIRNLGPGYVVWDKSATIRFRKPAKSTLTAEFTLAAEHLDALRAELEEIESVERTYAIELVDRQGVVCATVEKLIHVARRDRRREPPERPSPS